MAPLRLLLGLLPLFLWVDGRGRLPCREESFEHLEDLRAERGGSGRLDLSGRSDPFAFASFVVGEMATLLARSLDTAAEGVDVDAVLGEEAPERSPLEQTLEQLAEVQFQRRSRIASRPGVVAPWKTAPVSSLSRVNGSPRSVTPVAFRWKR